MPWPKRWPAVRKSPVSVSVTGVAPSTVNTPGQVRGRSAYDWFVTTPSATAVPPI